MAASTPRNPPTKPSLEPLNSPRLQPPYPGNQSRAEPKTQYILRSRSRIPTSLSSTSGDTVNSRATGTSSRSGGSWEGEGEEEDWEGVEGEYEGGDAYVCYLMSDDGGVVGPLKLDIEDVAIGLPDFRQERELLPRLENRQEEEGLRNRQSGSHGLNEFSSRSHSMLTVTIDTDTQDPEDDNLYITKRGKLSFVDLAGSEKVKDVSTTGAVESNSINKSLLVLGKCISHLGDSKRRQGHIPYRDSKLTKLLADSLGGNGVTLMIACINPSSANATETSNTLRYATRAKRIKTKPTVKMDPREKLIMSLKREIKILRNENHYLRQQIEMRHLEGGKLEFPAKPRGQLQRENDEKFMKFLKEQEKKESGLYEMLQEYMVENEALRSENSEMHSVRDRIRQDQQLLYRDNEKLMRRVEELERIITQNPALWNRSQPSSEDYRAGPRGPPPPNNDLYAPHPRAQSDPYGPALRGQAGGDSYAVYDYPRRSSPQGPHPNHPGFQQHKPPPREAYAEAPRNPQSPPPNRRPPMQGHGPSRPPHHLAEPIMRPAQAPMATYEPMHNGSFDNGMISARQSQPSSPRGKAGSFMGSPRQRPPPTIPNGQPRQGPPQGRKHSISSSDNHRDVNEKLMSEVEELNEEINGIRG